MLSVGVVHLEVRVWVVLGVLLPWVLLLWSQITDVTVLSVTCAIFVALSVGNFFVLEPPFYLFAHALEHLYIRPLMSLHI